MTPACPRCFSINSRLRRPPSRWTWVPAATLSKPPRSWLAFESVLLDWRPDLVVVVGDVNSTLACALVAAKLGIAIAHVEAGLRSFDRSMPEEINRVLTDQLSDVLFTTEQSAHENLRREGIPDERVHFVGNVMIDTLLAHRERARRLAAPARYGVASGEYVLLTLHRPTNVDDPTVFENLMGAIAEIASDVTVFFPVHPRTRPSVLRSAHAAALVSRSRLRLLEPLGYHEFIGLMDDSAAVLTDSGGAQEETTALGIPCLTLRREHRASDHSDRRHESRRRLRPRGHRRRVAQRQRELRAAPPGRRCGTAAPRRVLSMSLPMVGRARRPQVAHVSPW